MTLQSEPTKSNEYACAWCHGIFERGWSHEEALSESKELFGDIPTEETEVICDDCFKEMTRVYPPAQFAEDTRNPSTIYDDEM